MQNWLVIRTRPRWEKKVAGRLLQMGIEHFCPLVKEQRQWSDRKKIIASPLLKSLLFVRVSEEQRTFVRLTNGVINFVYQNGKPVIIREKLVQLIQQFQQTFPSIVVVSNDGQVAKYSHPNQGAGKNDKKNQLSIDALNLILIGGFAPLPFIEAPSDK